MSHYCGQCGTEIERRNKFCGNCGTASPQNSKFLYLAFASIPVLGAVAFSTFVYLNPAPDIETIQTSSMNLNNTPSSQNSRSHTPIIQNACEDYVDFTFDGPGPDYDSDIRMSGPTGTYESSNNGNLVAFISNSGCVAGLYSFTYTNDAQWFGGSSKSDIRTYRGTVSVSGERSHCSVLISESGHVTATC